MTNVRGAVYKTLIDAENDGKFANLALNAAFEKNPTWESSDKAYFTALFYGITERMITLDYLIETYTHKKITRLDQSVRTILRIGIYEILYLSTPDHAAVNESVKLSSRYASRAKGFINAVLRRVTAEKDQLPMPDPKIDLIRYFSVLYALPEWICRSLMSDYPENACRIMDCSTLNRAITLRVNSLRTTSEALRIEVNGNYSEHVETAVLTDLPISQLACLERGDAFVQDEASQIETAALNAKPGMTVIDVCACPGGKSFGAAISMQNQGTVYSFDLHASKLPLIEKTRDRLGLSCIRTREIDATKPINELAGQADRVICDVPCSGLGVLSKKADLRHKTYESIADLPELQKEILEKSSGYLKKGGILVYSTCTLRKSENEEIVADFLKRHSDFKPVDFACGDLSSVNGMLTLFPDVHHTDGFFIAKIQKS